MSTRHLILGETVDYITGRKIVDTVDERARQKIAEFLVKKKGYLKNEIEVRRTIPLMVDGNRAETKVDFIIRINGQAFAVIIFGPGSLVTRERSTLASARLVEKYEIPFAMITNGKEAEIMETKSGRVIARGLEAFFSKKMAAEKIKTLIFEKVSAKRLEKEKRILYAYDVLSEKECREYACGL